uniref:ESF1, nucleolar pre-rRNA processing protein, homolog n=1 Tax=Nothobranchius korthausae TaxID=1143690 RepID=A0A1A8HAI0_9TELE
MASKKKQDNDERFARVQKDPRFWEMPEKEQKIKIDKRFQSMFHDQRFKVKYTVDKRGRPISHSSAEDLKRFYKLSDSEDEAEEEEGLKVSEEKKKKVKPESKEKKGKAGQEVGVKGVRVTEEGGDDDDEEQPSAEEDADLEDDGSEGSEEDDDTDKESTEADGSEESSLDSGEDSDSEPDLARGRGNVETSSDEDDEDYVDAILRKEEEDIEHDWGELCKDAQRNEEVSARLAVCNMDWDRMKAKDLLVLFSSFVPKGGAVLSVKIYPSQFGKERLKAEETQGPPELKVLPDESEDDTEEERVYREKLRDYQFKRLKYFYGVLECDSVDTAVKIYDECDGFEYESSCSVLDLRFIPDDVTFDDEPKDVAMDTSVTAYTPKLFSSSATSTSKVKLTWDETDHERVTALSRKFDKNELLDMDFKAYLASSSEEGEDEEMGAEEEEIVKEVEVKPLKEKKKKKSEEQIRKYRELLKSVQSKEEKLEEDKDMEMEITWVPGLKEATEKLVKKKLEATDKLTPWEGYLQKKKEKKKQKNSERKQEAADDEFSDDELPPDVDLRDPFFTEELSASGDQTDVKKKRKDKKKKREEAEEDEELEKRKAEMALLMEDDVDETKHKHFNYEKIVEQQNLSKKKRKKLLKKGEELLEDDFQVDVRDPRFQAVFTSHLFNLDPSHPNFRKTKATQSILEEKQRRRQEEATPTQNNEQAAVEAKQDDDSARKTVMDPSLSLLVKSIKNKTEQFQARKKQKLQ